MAERFEDSLAQMKDALAWAEQQDVDRLRQFFVEDANTPLYVFSSGGSGGVGKYIAMLYETNKGMAKALTPLMMASVGDEALRQSKILLMTTSGKGVDEKYVVQRAVKVNPQGLCVVTRNVDDDNYVIKKLEKVTDNWHRYEWPVQPHSFIASTSTIARFGLYYKAFTNDSDILGKLSIDQIPSSCYTYQPRVEGEIPALKDIKNYMVLYAGWSEPIAFEFESMMVESGIASVQLCDYRNFCHGRFIFLSNHLEDTALVLFLTPREQQFARKLLLEGKDRGGKDLFPKNMAIASISTQLDSTLATIDLLLKERVFFSDVAQSNGIDPCSPPNPQCIDKRIPRSTAFVPSLNKLGPLNDNQT